MAEPLNVLIPDNAVMARWRGVFRNSRGPDIEVSEYFFGYCGESVRAKILTVIGKMLREGFDLISQQILELGYSPVG